VSGTPQSGCRHFAGAIVCSFSDDRDYRIRVGAKEYTFDFSERFGPTLIGKRGQFLESRMPKPFLVAVSWWARQGKRIDADGFCVWEQPMWKVYKVAGRQHVFEEDYRRIHKQWGLPPIEEVEPVLIPVRL